MIKTYKIREDLKGLYEYRRFSINSEMIKYAGRIVKIDFEKAERHSSGLAYFKIKEIDDERFWWHKNLFVELRGNANYLKD